jgi:methyl-accepting chemotaxis protein
MTTKYRIIVSFIVTTAITVGVAALGYVSMERASSSFLEYRRLARLNVTASDVTAGQYQTMSASRQFRMSYDKPEYMEAALAALRDSRKRIEDARSMLQLPETLTLADVLIKGMDEQISLNGRFRDLLTDFMTLYDQTVQPNNRIIGEKLTAVVMMSAEANNVDALQAAALALEELASYRAAVARFAFTRIPGDAALAVEALDVVNKAVAALDKSVFSTKGRAAATELLAAAAAADKATRTMVDRGREMDGALASLVLLGRQISQSCADFNRIITTLTERTGTGTMQANAYGQTVMLAGSAAGVVLAVVMTLLVVIGFVRVLRELGGFAGAVAAGKFDYQVKTREKGEIGAMVAAMRQITDVLKSIVEKYLDLEAKVKAGLLDTVGDAEKIGGEFAVLIKGTNGIMSGYLNVVDNIPTPVLMLSKDGKAEYLNGKARELAGSEYRGKSVGQLFTREDEGAPEDALRKALESGQAAGAETRVHARGKDMDIAYTAIPILNKGAVASVLLLITDLTLIKDARRAIQNAASQAVAVSSRLAAAAEELSAQVEQVSRGAEMQRAQVESTASAMTAMNSTVLTVAGNAGRASEQSELTRTKAESGAELVNKVARSVNMVNRAAETLQMNMKDLGSQAESIGGVMNVISDIADQTNLLALNAAIEAARAGEAGRGFAVVADEVRKLAEKTMSATQEVGTSIKGIQQSALTNIAEVGVAAAAVADAAELADSSGQALAEIVTLASSNSQVVVSIATAAEEQSATSEEINRAVEKINQVVGETSNGMVQASKAVLELSQTANELNRIIGELR